VLAPAFVEDVAAVLAAADDRAGAVNGTWGLEGPDPLTADQLADLLAGRHTAKIHLPVRAAAAWGRLGGRSVPLPALEVLAADSVADRPDASAEFGVRRTPLSEGLARSVDGRAE
jgi:uncharacterized protein YbjT (DUF2867 family)